MSERIGILGGTFDPIHYGHLAIAEEARWQLDLARVFFVPAARQPLKGRHHVPAEHRLAMTRLATGDNPCFEVCDLEVRRAGPSYTIDTIVALEADNRGAEFVFLVGADVLNDLHRWHAIDRLLVLCHFAIFTRPGYALDLGRVETVLPTAHGRIQGVEGPALDISATDLRRRLAESAPVRYQMPDVVIRYIEEHGLYR